MSEEPISIRTQVDRIDVTLECRDKLADDAITSDAELVAPPLIRSIGRYRVESPIGQGGFGVVYLAFDEQLARKVAIKIPHRELTSFANASEAYLTEARTVANLDHPNIVPVYDWGATEEHPCFIVMKYIEGADLFRYLKRSPSTPIQCADLIATLGSALHYAHKQGYVHRDLKPSNILIDKALSPWIVDFGLALREHDLGKGPRYVGTALYMSPEQARGEGHRVDGRSDIYSLGAVLYEMLTGQRTVAGATRREILERVSFQDVKPLRQIDDSIPRDLERICLKALAKRASERYPTAQDFAEELREVIDVERTIGVQAGGTPNSLISTARRSVRGDSLVTPFESSHESHAIHVVPKGLRSFESHDADFFLALLPGPYDRAGVPDSVRFWKRRLEERDDQSTFTVGVMYGPSGCGKSSLVKAGILPLLTDDVISIFVEASPDNTERDLLGKLRSRWCRRDDTRELGQLVAALRLGEGPGVGRKVLIVIDQFEQWLNATADYSRSEILQALRQCDGGRVQCLLLVRDDFWLPVSRFMRSLEVRLIEGHNSAMVDLFDRAHAATVLTAFGRAYGRLPASSRLMATEQYDFIEAAVTALADNGKVISVRLSLIAEMMKARPWTPDSLASLGGTTGIGVAFLEQTFSSPTAPPEHRFHQKAACAVLKALLPTTGVDIKGEMKSYAALLDASGYQHRREDFQDLIRILDSEVRLIAPTDPEGSFNGDDSGTASSPGEQYYQLTHDYLVHSLRQWLTGKQKSTRRGRAELCLDERTSMWNSRRETRFLPSVWEWLAIRLFTSSRDWSPIQRQMMHRMRDYLFIRILLLGVITFILSVVGWEFNGRRRSELLVDAVQHAPTREVPAIILEMQPYRRWVNHKLRERLDRVDKEVHELHFRMAMLPTDAAQIEWLLNFTLRATPEEVDSIRLSLQPRSDDCLKRLWAIATEEDLDGEERLRTACVLAFLAPNDSRWESISQSVLESLERQDSMLVRDWVDLLHPARIQLLPVLAELIADSRDSEKQIPLSSVFVEFADSVTNGFDALNEVLSEPVGSGSEELISRARRKANVAATLALANQWPVVLPLLSHQIDPTLRSQLIQRLGTMDIFSLDLREQLSPSIQPDPSVRQAIILILGDVDNDRASKRFRSAWLPALRQLCILEDSGGVRSASQWVLKQWNETVPSVSNSHIHEGDTESLHPEAGAIPVQMPEMVEIPPGKLGFQDGNGQPQELKAERAFAIATTEVSVAEFLRFRSEQNWDRRAAPTSDCPVHEVTWFDAVAYCNWLSEQAGLDRSQWCYLPNEQGSYDSGMIIPADSLDRKGYRLATTQEWEYACRAGSKSYWSMGEDPSLLDRYAWSMSNSGIHSRPVAQLRPNALGLFDMHGNVWEWCHDLVDAQGKPLAGASTTNTPVNSDTFCSMRGGTYLTDPLSLGSSFSNWNVASKKTNADGFRIAKTLAGVQAADR